MEVFSGFMVVVSIFLFLLTVVWLIMPFVMIAVKVKVDRSYLLLEEIERRLAEMERRVAAVPGEPVLPPDEFRPLPPE